MGEGRGRGSETRLLLAEGLYVSEISCPAGGALVRYKLVAAQEEYRDVPIGSCDPSVVRLLPRDTRK